jgi:DNA-binding PadR family transcriptional regulator
MAKKGLFRHGELHLVVLALLERQSMHGYQLMGELARLFAPDYRPSPGSVYPCIEALADADLIAGVDEGGRRVYQLTPAGSEALTRRSYELVEIEARTGVRVGGSGDVEGALQRFAARVRAAAPLHDLATVEDFLDAAAEEIEQLRRGDFGVKKAKGRLR